MFTWTRYEFHETVTFPKPWGPCGHLDTASAKRIEEDATWVTFVMADDLVVRTPVANVRYVLGHLTPQVVTDDVPVTLPAPPASKKSKKVWL